MTNRFLAGIIALALSSIIALPVYSQNEPTAEKKALIKELLGLLNAANNAEAIMANSPRKLDSKFTTNTSPRLK